MGTTHRDALLLREHGWEPEIERDNGPSYWEWKSIRGVPSVAARTHRRRVRAVPCSRKLPGPRVWRTCTCRHRAAWCASWPSARLPPAILYRGAHAADRARGRSQLQEASGKDRDEACGLPS